MKWPWGIVFWSFHFISAGAQVFHSAVKSAYLTGGAYSAHFTDAFSFTVNPAVLGGEKTLRIAISSERRWMLKELAYFQMACSFSAGRGGMGFQFHYTGNSFKGHSLSNASFDYGYTFRNIHLFGELAADRERHLAFVQGALLGLGDQIDLAFLYRNISAAYQSIYSDAFTENGSPVNEKGLYTGISFRPQSGLRVEMYYDLFVFPWLKYRVDAPSKGNDFLIRAFFQPNKSWYLSFTYKTEKKAENREISQMSTHPVFSPVKKRWQLEMGYKIDLNWRIKSRMEAIWIRKDWVEIKTKPEGFLGFLDIFYNSGILNGNLRIQRFLTPGYDFRIYIYESDMLFNFSLPSYFDNGWRYYVNLHKGFPLDKMPGIASRRKLNIWIKWGESIYPGKAFTGSSLDRINSDRKTTISVQLRINW